LAVGTGADLGAAGDGFGGEVDEAEAVVGGFGAGEKGFPLGEFGGEEFAGGVGLVNEDPEVKAVGEAAGLGLGGEEDEEEEGEGAEGAGEAKARPEPADGKEGGEEEEPFRGG
jgi:hypothetical protein